MGSKYDKGRRLLASLKSVAGSQGPQLGIQVAFSEAAWLRPVATRRELQNENDIRCLTDWRNSHVTSFLSEFEATNPRTSEWLAGIVGPDDSRILFMVDGPNKQAIGYMGIGFIDWETGYCEADSIVRGVTGFKGLMTCALDTLLSWGRGQLGLTTIGVRVRSDNPALKFYSKFGFTETKRVPLRVRSDPDSRVWYEDPGNADADISLVYHNLSR